LYQHKCVVVAPEWISEATRKDRLPESFYLISDDFPRYVEDVSLGRSVGYLARSSSSSAATLMMEGAMPELEDSPQNRTSPTRGPSLVSRTSPSKSTLSGSPLKAKSLVDDVHSSSEEEVMDYMTPQDEEKGAHDDDDRYYHEDNQRLRAESQHQEEVENDSDVSEAEKIQREFSSSSSAQHPPQHKLSSGDGSWIERAKSSLACQSMLTDNDKRRPVNRNQYITDKLERLGKIYAAKGDKWRPVAYKKAVNIIERQPKTLLVEDLPSLRRIRGIGRRIVDKIEEIIRTGELKRLQVMEMDPSVKSLELFGKIWGVGAATAQAVS